MLEDIAFRHASRSGITLRLIACGIVVPGATIAAIITDAGPGSVLRPSLPARACRSLSMPPHNLPGPVRPRPQSVASFGHQSSLMSWGEVSGRMRTWSHGAPRLDPAC